MMDTETVDLLATLRSLEVALHRPDVRADRQRLAQLLHPAFREFGRSGAGYTREQVLAALPAQAPGAVVWSQDFVVEALANGVALLTYRSAHVSSDGRLERHTNRASVWQRSAQGAWQMRFHQGTPTAPFDPAADGGPAPGLSRPRV